MLEQQAAK